MFSKSTIKYIQSLQHKKFRDEFNVFFAEGPKVVKELLDADIFVCINIYATAQWVKELSATIKNSVADKIEVIQDFELEKISALSKANAVLAVFEKKSAIKFTLENKLSLVLDDIQDPGNLGTIIRIADWFGIENIFCSLHTADMYNPKVVQSTMASLARVNIFYTDIAALLRNSNVKKYAAALDGKPVAAIGNLKEGLLIIGNESKGISDEVFALANEKITIPKLGAAESLNAGIATGIILYELTGKGS